MSSVNEFPPQLIQLFKEETLDLLGQWENSCIALQQQPEKSDWDQLFAAVHSIKGSVQTLGLQQFSEYLAVIENYLGANSVGTIQSKQLQALFKAQSNGIEWVANIEILDDLSITVEIESFKRDIGESYENNIEGNLDSNVIETYEKENNKRYEAASEKKVNSPRQEFKDDVRISGKLVDKILDQLNEIQTHQTIMENHFLGGDANRNLAVQSLTISQSRIRDLRRQVSNLRSVNAEVVFKRVVRAVTEANLALDKNVQVQFEGHLVKLDKSLADQIVSSLIHIVRNCVDHGIESCAERAKLGKNENGLIQISVRRRVKNIEIIVKDDGAGINTTVLMEKALAKGVIQKIPTDLNNELILQVLCSPGLSTSQTVSEISGRGVGMNAVSEKIFSLGGNLKLSHERDVGTAFSITVPNSITSLKAIVVVINDYKVAIPMNEISEVCQFNKADLQLALGEAKIEFNEDIIQYFSLADVLDKNSCNGTKTDQMFGLICGNGLLKTVYGVDSIIGQQEVVVRLLEAQLTALPGCQGAAYFSDGSPGLVLSLNKLKQNTLVEVVH